MLFYVSKIELNLIYLEIYYNYNTPRGITIFYFIKYNYTIGQNIMDNATSMHSFYLIDVTMIVKCFIIYYLKFLSISLFYFFINQKFRSFLIRNYFKWTNTLFFWHFIIIIYTACHILSTYKTNPENEKGNRHHDKTQESMIDSKLN